MVKTPSFDYEVRRTREGVEVEVGRYRWKGFALSLLWVIVWLIAAFEASESWWGQTTGYFVILACVLYEILGMPIAVYSVLRRTLILSPSGLGLRSSFFGIGTRRSINLSDVNNFGFGYPSHSRSAVLRLELRTSTARTKWIELARGTTEEEVKAFLNDIEAQGFRLPR